jgi:hypothetical protein
MTQLQRLVLDFRSGELVIRVLYRSKGESNPGTKARTREVTELARSGLTRALEALDAGDVAICGTSGFSQREDLLSVAVPRPDELKGARRAASWSPRRRQREGTTTRYVRFLGGFTGAWLVCDPDGAFYVRKAGADPDHARGEEAS